MTTQNDWAERFDKFFCTASGGSLQLKGCFDLSVGSCVEVMPQIKAFIAKELADARKEVVTEVEKMLWSIHKDEINGANIRWNESLGLAISRLATLGEEEDVEGQMKHWGYGEGIEQTAVKAKGSALTLDKLNES